MLRSLFLLGVALAATVATRAGAQACAEPSALDLDPAAVPLRVAKSGADLALSWEDTAAPEYRLHVGFLDTLRSQRRYDHGVVAASSSPSMILPAPAEDAYFLVEARCDGVSSSVGRNDSGTERPGGQYLRVHVGVEGTAVFGVQMRVLAPPGVFVAGDLASFTGPFDSGAAGAPISGVGDLVPRELSVLAAFSELVPDPSFDAPAGTPVEILHVDVGVSGPFPDGTGYSLGDCRVRDEWTDPVTDGACLILDVSPAP
jgi:hypothetical protein